MKIALLTQGSRGDVEPFVRLGKTLKRRGHEVTLSAPRNFTKMIESAGLKALPVEIDIEEILGGDEGADILKARPLAVMRKMSFFYDFTEKSLDSYLGLAKENDRVVYHVKTFCDCFAHLFPGKMIRAMVVPVEPTGEFSSPALSGFRLFRNFPGLSYFLQDLGLKSMKKPVLRFAVKNGIEVKSGLQEVPFIYGISETLLHKPADYPSSSFFTGFWSEQDNMPLSPQIEDFLSKGSSPVVVTFGSMVDSKIDFSIGMIVKILQDLGKRVIVIRGWNKSGYDLMDTDNVLVVDSAPYSALFKESSALISHGGIGTVSAALEAGIPMITMPVMFPVGDQMFWGLQLEKAGVSAGTLPVKKAKEKSLMAMLERLVNDRRLAEKAREIQSVLRQENGLENAAEIIESFAKF